MMTRKKEVVTVRPGSFADRQIRRYGKFWGEVVLNITSWAFAFAMLLFTILVSICLLIFIDSFRYRFPDNFTYSSTIFIFSGLFVFLFSILFVRLNKNEDFRTFLKRYFSIQVIVGILAFAQTVVWMVDSETPGYEPRVAFFTLMSVLLAYFRKQFTTYIMNLIALEDEQRDALSIESLESLPAEKNDLTIEELSRFYDLEEHPQESKSSRET